MRTEVYYFSGTGNSLAVARGIAEKINGTLISIPTVMDEPSVKTDADGIGIVFPCYLAQLYGIPLIVASFVKKLEDLGSKYIFAVCTCGGFENVNALPTLKNLEKIIQARGGKLAAEFTVRLPMNNLDYSAIPFPIDQDQETMFRNSQVKIEAICQRVAHRKKSPYKTLKGLFNGFMTPLYRVLQNFYIADLKEKSQEPKDTTLAFDALIPLTDKSIYADDQCNGCATCARVCPVQNIKMVDDRPVWQHRCEMCLACAEFCPTQAIHHWNRDAGIRYRHPDVKLGDMLRAAPHGAKAPL